jgi:hypothetical protein
MNALDVRPPHDERHHLPTLSAALVAHLLLRASADDSMLVLSRSSTSVAAAPMPTRRHALRVIGRRAGMRAGGEWGSVPLVPVYRLHRPAAGTVWLLL